MSLDKNLGNLNVGISTLIATFLETKDLLNLCFINRRWVALGNNSILWQSKFQKSWELFTSGKYVAWSYLKWVSYIDKNVIMLDKVGTLFTLTEGVFENWDDNKIVPQTAIKFQWPVKTVDIFGKEIWAVDIYGGLSLICSSLQPSDIRSKLWKKFNFFHLERRTFKYPIQNICTLEDASIVLYCNNRCEILFGDSNNPVMKYNVKQIGVVDGNTLYYLGNDNCLYQFRYGEISMVIDNVKSVFEETTYGIIYVTRENLVTYYDKDTETELCTVDDVHQIGLLKAYQGTNVLLIIDNMKKLKGYDFNMVKAAPGRRVTPKMSLPGYEIDNISNVCTSNNSRNMFYLISVSNELFFTGHNNYPKLYSASPTYTDNPIKVESNILKIKDSDQAMAFIKQYGSDLQLMFGS